MNEPEHTTPPLQPPLRRRRPRYPGKYPRRFDQKYKERDPERYEETVAKVIAAGKTPAGSHRPIMVREVLEILAPHPGALAVDCTLGFGGHAVELLSRIQPNGRLIGLDADPIELQRAEVRLRALGYGPHQLLVFRSNFAGLPQVLAAAGVSGADLILADLGVSSMQLDDPARGFSFKHPGPLDMRLNPHRGQPASLWLSKVKPSVLARALLENADEPRAPELAGGLAGRIFATTTALREAIEAALPHVRSDERDLTVRRVFQALRIAVNDEFSALETFLRHLPACLNPGGRAAILTFHSGEDGRVKRALEAGLAQGVYSAIARDVLRPSPAERRENLRSGSAKLRWAHRGQADKAGVLPRDQAGDTLI